MPRVPLPLPPSPAERPHGVHGSPPTVLSSVLCDLQAISSALCREGPAVLWLLPGHCPGLDPGHRGREHVWASVLDAGVLVAGTARPRDPHA